MDKYENMEVVGEGSYGIVMKCKHKETGQVVAIKKFLESVENVHVRKLAFREIRMLKRLRHENLVSLIEVFRRKKRFYLVFEYLDHTILDELESVDGGLGLEISRRYIYQVLRGLDFCHQNHIMHRDVKPENVLVSPRGVVKLCDFGFARIVTGPNESCTDYVATRWYRAPELLVGDSRYGRGVDTWATGCLYAEILTGDPLFPGDSDVDQLFRITRMLGGLCARHQNLMNRSSNGGRNEMRMLRRTSADCLTDRSTSGPMRTLRALLPNSNATCIDFLMQCLRMDPELRPSCAQLLQHPLFMQEGFADKFLVELRELVAKEVAENPLLQYRREDERRPSLKSLDEHITCYSGVTRWHMKMMRDSSLNVVKSTDGKPPLFDHPTITRNREEDAPCQQAPSQHNTSRGSIHLSRPREVCYLGPSNVTPNATYIRRLEHKGLLPSLDSNNKNCCALPALNPKACCNNKRSKLDLTSQIA